MGCAGRLAVTTVLGLLLVLAWPSVQADRDDFEQPTVVPSGEKSKSKANSIDIDLPVISAPAYRPPPRTIADVLAKLGPAEATPADCAAQQRQRRIDEANQRKWLKEHYANLSDREVSSAADEVLGENPAVREAWARGNMALELSNWELAEGKTAGSIEWLKLGLAGVPLNWRSSRLDFNATLSRRYALIGDFDAAEDALKRAIAEQRRIRDGDQFETVEAFRARAGAQVEMSRGRISEAEGDYRQAEQHYRQALVHRAMPSVGVVFDDHVLYTDIARVLMRQGRLAEAEARARKTVLIRGTIPIKRAHLVLVLAEVLYEQERYAEAQTIAARAVNIYESKCITGSSLRLGLARQMLARAKLAQGDWESALAEYEVIRRGMAAEQPELFRLKFAQDVDWGRALLKAGQSDQAAPLLARSYEYLQNRLGTKHENTVTAQGFLAAAYSAQGNDSKALDVFEDVVPALIRSWRENPKAVDGARAARMREILEAYIELVDRIRGSGLETRLGIDAVGEMFRVADIVRGSSVQRALAANTARAAAADPALAELARRQQDTQNHVEALESVLVAATSMPLEDQNPESIRGLQLRIAEAREAQTLLLAEVQSRFPGYAALVSPEPPTLDRIRATLLPGEALVAILVSDARTYVWAVPRTGPIAYHRARLGKESVERIVSRLRASVDAEIESLDDIRPFDVETAHSLYRDLLGPVRSGWSRAERLLIVSNGALTQLPVSVLPVEPVPLSADSKLPFDAYREIPWLARTHAVIDLPSVGSLLGIRAVTRGAEQATTFIGFGDPWFSREQAARARSREDGGTIDSRSVLLKRRLFPRTREADSAKLDSLPRLPDTREEVLEMAEALGADPAEDVFLGEQASETRVRTMDLSARRVVAFATHGLVPGDLDGLVQPALALSSPEVTGEEQDGLLTMGEILELQLDADWVILSACNTASGDGAGAEAVSGLGRAFFYAGARSLLVTHWPVETTSARSLTVDIFKRQLQRPGLSRAEALRQSMMSLVDGPGYVDEGGKSLFSFAHPVFWAPFALVGDGS